MVSRRDVMSTGSVNILRYVRRTNVGGAVEYMAQFLGGVIHPELLRSGAERDQDTDRLATLAGASRMVAGLAFISAPGPVGRLLIDGDADRPGTQLFIRAFGARDVLLGAGVVLTRRDKRARRTWLASCALADAFDAAAALAGYGSLPQRQWRLALTISAVPALLNLTLARRLTRITQRHRRAGSSS